MAALGWVVRQSKARILIGRSTVSLLARFTSKRSDEDNIASIEIPVYEANLTESIDVKKARLLYQSRKRGMLENDLILSTFAAKHLSKMNQEQIRQYDLLINLPSNDWDLYNWAVGNKPTPPEFDNEVMDMLKKHVLNENRDVRSKQPDLY